MSKVTIDRDRDGWHFYGEGFKSDPASSTYGDVVRLALSSGHEIDSGGWLKRMLSWNFNHHAIDGYPGWEIEREKSPAFVKLTHTRGDGRVESHALASAWDDLAVVDFYQRDWTEDGIPFVRNGETYWSGWWFATIAERDRFLAWHAERSAATKSTELGAGVQVHVDQTENGAS